MSSDQPHTLPNRRHCLAALGAAAWPFDAARARSDRPEMVLRFSHVVAEETPKGLAANRFKALVEQRSAGRIAIQVFPNAQLYGDHDEMQALQLGAVDFVAPSLSKFSRIGLPEFELFDLPFLFEHLSEVRRITQGALGRRLLKGLGRSGLVGLGFFDNGFKQMSANRPLLNPSDYVGLRMRVQASQVITDQMRALGATPVRLSFSETRAALEAGVVDGTENPVSNFYTQSMHQVQSDLSLTHHAYLGYAVVSNQRFWDKLASQDRDLLSQAMQESLGFANRIADVQNDKALQALQASPGMRIHTLSIVQRSALKTATAPVKQALSQRIGEGWMQALEAALSRPARGES
jgi:C4-dicarboxylate-binding protein DctP